MATQGSASSDYYDDDPAFVEAISNMPLEDTTQISVTPFVQRDEDLYSGAPPPAQPSLKKRARSPDDDSEDGTEFHQVLNSSHADADSVPYLSSDTYGASRFGEFGEYMTRKRAKLQIQNTEMDMEGNKQDATTRLFRGLQIYVRQYLWRFSLCSKTDPLRRLTAGLSHLYKTSASSSSDTEVSTTLTWTRRASCKLIQVFSLRIAHVSQDAHSHLFPHPSQGP